jgi:hypothetical protein
LLKVAEQGEKKWNNEGDGKVAIASGKVRLLLLLVVIVLMVNA